MVGGAHLIPQGPGNSLLVTSFVSLFFFFLHFTDLFNLSPRGHPERQAEFHASTQDEA